MDHFIDEIEETHVVDILKLFEGYLGIELKEFQFSFLKVSFEEPF